MDNKNQPLIGITTREIVSMSPRYLGMTSSTANDAYSMSVLMNNASPVLVPVLSESEHTNNFAKNLVQRLDGFVFTGGDDIVPYFYGEMMSHKLGEIEEKRDIWELCLIKEAMHQKKPILAICRGIQLLNVSCGGSLYQDLEDFPDETINHAQPGGRSMASHPINIKKDSLLNSVVGDQCWVNSFHHQAIKKVGNGLVATAHSPDGVVEAVESTNVGSFTLGVQFHPESMTARHKSADNIFKAFISACSKTSDVS